MAWVELSENLTLTPLLVAVRFPIFWLKLGTWSSLKTLGPRVPGATPRASGLLTWLLMPGPQLIRIRRVSFPKGAELAVGLRVSLGKIAPN
jgi:hypothetical protein